MSRLRCMSAAVLLVAIAVTGVRVAAPVTVEEADTWLRHIIPLPKEITIEGKLEVPAAAVGVQLRDGAGEVEQTARHELIALFQQKASADGTGGEFQIFLGVCDETGKVGDWHIPGAAGLRKLPNWQQAYVIRAVGEHRLVLTALDERGVYYAAQTLRQLLEGQFAGGRVTIPLARVTDWPDMAKRGECLTLGAFPREEIEWMAHHKMNVLEYHVPTIVRKGSVEVKAWPERIAHARRHAFDLVPIIGHLMQLGQTGAYEAYPDLKAKGEQPFSGGNPCASNPKLVDVLAQIMEAMATQGATDISGWLSEGRGYQCQCDKCLAEGPNSQYWLEARAYGKAWQRVRQQYPDLGLSVLLTQGSYATNDRVLAELPEEVEATYYNSGSTYNSRPDPMIYPLLEEYAQQGGHLGVVPQLTAKFSAVVPGSGPQFIRYRMNEFVNKGVEHLDGYAPPSNRLYRFNIAAAAEWSWNAKGRDEHEFAAAYATQRGVSDPEAFADWAVTMGRVGWDIFGTDLLYGFIDGGVTRQVIDWNWPRLGKNSGPDRYNNIFRELPSVEQMDQNLRDCEAALGIAQRLQSPEMIAETRVIQGYMKMVRAIYTIANKLADTRTPRSGDRALLQQAMTNLAQANCQTTQYLHKWLELMDLGYEPSRFGGTIKVKDETVLAIGEHVVSLYGIPNPGRPYINSEIWNWTSKELPEEGRRTVRVDVTEEIPHEGGRLEVHFDYPGGEQGGLEIYRVALASAPVDNPDQLTEISADEHHAITGYRQIYRTYRLNVAGRDSTQGYFIVAEVEAIRPPDPLERQGTVSMVTVMPNDFNPNIWNSNPMPPAFSEEELARLEPQTIYEWSTEDFAESQRVTMKWDMTEQITSAASYGLKFRYTSGQWGASIYRVALAYAPADQPEELVELSVDEHEANVGHVARSSRYTVTLDEHRAEGRYYILADMKGVGPDDYPDKPKGCSGVVWMRPYLIGQ